MSMNAKELADLYRRNGFHVIDDYGDGPVILRALDLLAAVEGSTDEIVRELRGLSADAVPDSGTEKICDKAAAALVAMKAEKEKAEAELAENEGVIAVWRRRTQEAEAERDDLKRHAEAMARTLELHGRKSFSLISYRAAHPEKP